MWSERRQTEKAIYYMISFIWCSGKDKTIVTENTLPRCRVEWKGLTTNEHETAFRSDRNALYPNCGGGYMTSVLK